MNHVKIVACLLLVSTFFCAYGMKQKSRQVTELSQIMKKVQIDKPLCCNCDPIFVKDKHTREETIIHVIDHDCIHCFLIGVFKHNKNKWKINQRLFCNKKEKGAQCGKTPLLYACQRGAVEIVKFLLSRSALMSLSECKGGISWSAIHFATVSEYESHTLIELLLKKSPQSIYEPTKGGIKFVNLVQFNQSRKTFKLQCMPGTTALYIACFKGNIPRIEYLLSQGANIMHCLENGENIFHEFGRFLEAYSQEKIEAPEEFDLIKKIVTTLEHACDTITYTPEHLDTLCRLDKKFRDTIFCILLIHKRRGTVLALLPGRLLKQLLFKYIKRTSTILYEMPGVDGKSAAQRLTAQIDLDLIGD